jgi:hypothetical protein
MAAEEFKNYADDLEVSKHRAIKNIYADTYV